MFFALYHSWLFGKGEGGEAGYLLSSQETVRIMSKNVRFKLLHL